MEGKEERLGQQPRNSEGWRKMYLVSATPLRPSLTLRSNWSLWQGSHKDWWDESKGWWRWVLSICCHDVGCSGCARSWASVFSSSNSGHRKKSDLGPGAQPSLRAVARLEWRSDRWRLLPIPSDSTCRKGGLLWLPCVNRTPQIIVFY